MRCCEGLAMLLPRALGPSVAMAGSIMFTQWTVLGTHLGIRLSEDVGKKKVRLPERTKPLLAGQVAAGGGRVRIVFGSRRACLPGRMLQECIEQLVLRACLILAFSLFLREDDVFQHGLPQVHSRRVASLFPR